MYWADQLAEQINKKQKNRVDDMKTPSGHAHAGSLRAIATHGLLYETLKTNGFDVDFTYVVNNMDPMDGLPVYLDKKTYEQHMGKPLYAIPAPDGKSENYSAMFANEYIAAFNMLGFKPQIIWSTDLYREGKIDKYIQLALDNVDTIRAIYKKEANQSKPKDWYPFQVICPNCGLVGASLVTDWDGKTVAYECKPDLVEWAKGCGHTGRVSPFGGTGKLMWKIDWAAHWAALNITVEGAGKDHFSKGGSRYIAAAAMKEVFKEEPPFGFLHEFLLIGGAKMSSSKGNATSAYKFAHLLPPELGRFLFVRTPVQRAINFDPFVSSTIPDLFDEYDRCAESFFETGAASDFGRYFQAAQLKVPSAKLFIPRFRSVATVIQLPSVDPAEYFAKEKGSELNKEELAILNERVTYARLWLDNYADESEKYEIKNELPGSAQNLTDEQKKFLQELAEIAEAGKFKTAEELQQKIYELAKATLGTKSAFAAIYQVLLGKDHGPKAGWLIFEKLKTDKELITGRFSGSALGANPTPLHDFQ